MNTLVKIALPALSLTALSAADVSAATRLVNEGKSSHSIVIPAKAPHSLRQAAAELQRSIEESSGAKLPIRSDAQAGAGAYISLGATRQAQQNGLSVGAIGIEGYRILTKNNNLYILGPDTAAKVSSSRTYLPFDTFETDAEAAGPQRAPNNGFSNGTANGVYSFLEDYIGVRWLMPGDIGRDIPRQKTLDLPAIDRTYAPVFVRREFPYLQNTPAVQEWTNRQKLGYSFQVHYDHNWLETVPPEMYQTHPEWFAMIGDKRPAPPLDGPRREYSKLESTNPEVVRYFADKAIAYLKANPTQNTFSLSPSDGRGWSESPESKKLYDPAPPGGDFPSMTPLVLKFYRDVSEIVAKEYPQGKLAGFIYQDFKYVPTKGGMKLPDNFTPVIVLGDGGYRLYRDDERREAKLLMESWSKVAPPTWIYYSFGNWLRSSSGMFTPVAAGNLNYIFDLLRKNGIKGARLYGTPAWGQAAAGNYVQAKLMWNPSLDAEVLQKDWLMRAYGPQAGPVMEKFHAALDKGFATFWQANVSANHNTREPLFQYLYGAIYPELETLFVQAKAQPMTAAQAKRLALIEDNMVVLQWRLHNAGYLPKDFNSSLQRGDSEVVSLLLKENADFEGFPDILSGGPLVSPVRVQLGQAPAGGAPAPVPNANSILLYARQAGTVRLVPQNVRPGSAFLSYSIRDAQDQGRVLQSGVLYIGGAISIEAKAGQAFYFYVDPAGVDVLPDASWELLVENAAATGGSFQNGVLHLDEKAKDALVFVSDALPLKTEAKGDGILLRPKTTADERNEAAQKLYPTAKPFLELSNDWRFATDEPATGLQQGWAGPVFNDAGWKQLNATDWWQNQGFANYFGATWYRKTVIVPPIPIDQLLVLFFGAVDGDAEVFINGQKVGEHLLGKDGYGWDKPFGIDVSNALKTGQNTIAVKVTKTNNMGGIHKGVSLLMMEDSGTY